MNKLKKWVANNRKKAIVIGMLLLSLILSIIFLIGVISYLMPNTRESVYGDRCEFTAEHAVKDERESKIKDFLKDYENMDMKKFEVKCNLINIIIEVDDKTSFSKVKSMGKKLLSVFDEDELKYYDIQLMIKSNKENSDDYPKIGSHHKEINGSTNEDFIW